MNVRPVMLFLWALLASCAANQESGFVTVPWQPANVGDAGTAARAYHDSGAYQRGLELVANQAASWIKTHASGARQPALVLDIDETALAIEMEKSLFGIFCRSSIEKREIVDP